jgi:hypothetical protein
MASWMPAAGSHFSLRFGAFDDRPTFDGLVRKLQFDPPRAKAQEVT